jgi:hypothetical protein
MLRFNTNLHTTFEIPKFVLSAPLHIKLQNQYLSSHPTQNTVHFSDEEFHWIIEHDGLHYYIKSYKPRYNFTQYLGAPNKNGEVFLYTSKNRFTRWSIHRQNDMYYIQFTGEKFNTKEISVVVARYNENVEWVRAYSDIAFIYNKGEPITEKALQLENVGREGHTYLYHIITNYNTLTERTVFLQGNPFEHNPTVLYGLDNYELTLDVQPLGYIYLQNIDVPPSILVDAIKIHTDYGLVYLTLEIDCNLKSEFYNDHGTNNVCSSYKHINKCYNETVIKNFLTRIQYPYDTHHMELLRFTFCALFSVRREKIQQHTIEQYTQIIKILLTHDTQGGEEGYVLERLWLYIFGYEH